MGVDPTSRYHCLVVPVGAVAVGTRPMGIRKVRASRWRPNLAGRWVWHCRICRLECTYPGRTLVGIYASALEHLEDEHLGTRRAALSPIAAARDAVLERLAPVYRQRLLESPSLDDLLEEVYPGCTQPSGPHGRLRGSLDGAVDTIGPNPYEEG